MKIERKRAHFKNKKNQNLIIESQKEKKHLNSEIFTDIISFTVDQNSYKLRDIWIFDLGANSHIYNNSLRFRFKRLAIKNNKLIADKLIYFIKMFESVNIFI